VCVASISLWSQATRDPTKDREAIIALEQEWLHASNAATLDRILASDFVHVVPVDHFLTKQEHIDWVIKHPEPKDRHTRFDKLHVRLYGDVGIVNGSVIASDLKRDRPDYVHRCLCMSRWAVASGERAGEWDTTGAETLAFGAGPLSRASRMRPTLYKPT